MELIIQKLEDIAKLEGWTIQKASVSLGADPLLTLNITHPAAEKAVNLRIIGGVHYQRVGNNITVLNSTFTIKSEDT